MSSITKDRTVLVAGHESEARSYTEMSLKSFGYLVEFAEDADEVLRFLRNRSISVDAVLLDLVMANRDGFDVSTEEERAW